MSSPRLATFAFFDPTSGYGLFVQGAGHGCQEEVGRTTDGGATFGPLVTVAPCATLGRGAAVAFDDHGDGFVFDPTSRDLYVTHDGGTAWAPTPQRGDVLSVEALGYSVWMLQSSCRGAARHARTCVLSVRESSDGGRTWQSGAPLPGRGTASRGGPRVAPGSMVRVSQAAAYVLGSPGPASTQGTSRVPMWATGNGGRSWTRLAMPCGVGAAVTARMSVAPTGALFTVCAGARSAGDQEKSAAVSSDGGLDWTRPGGCVRSRAASCATAGLGVGYLGEVDAVSASAAYVFGAHGPLDQTVDGGASWTPVSAPFAGAGPAAMAFFNAADGVVGTSAAGTFEVWHTADGGTAWTVVQPTVETRGLDWPATPPPTLVARWHAT